MPVLPQSSQREPQGSQRLGLKKSQVAFTTSPLRPLRRHGVLRGKKLHSGLNDIFLPQSSQRKPQGSQRLGLNESQVAFTTAPLRPLRRHGVLCV